MAYSDFTLNLIQQRFGIKNRRTRISEDFALIQPSTHLRSDLSEVEELPIRSEKAKSEWILSK